MLRLHRIAEAPDGSCGSGGPGWQDEDDHLTLEEARDEPTAPGADRYYGAGDDSAQPAAVSSGAAGPGQGSILDMLANAVPGDRRRTLAAYGNFPVPAAARPVLHTPVPAPKSGFGWIGSPPRRPRPGGWTSIAAYGSLVLLLVAALGLATFAGMQSGTRPAPGARTVTVEIAGEGIRP